MISDKLIRFRDFYDTNNPRLSLYKLNYALRFQRMAGDIVPTIDVPVLKKHLKKIFKPIPDVVKKAIFFQIFDIDQYAERIQKELSPQSLPLVENRDHLNVIREIRVRTRGMQCEVAIPYRVLYIQLNALLIDPKNYNKTYRDLKKNTKDRFQKSIEQFQRLGTVILCQTLQCQINMNARTTNTKDEERIEKCLSSLKRASSLFPNCEKYMTPEGYKELEKLLNIFKTCFSNPKTLFPILYLPSPILEMPQFVGNSSTERELLKTYVHVCETLWSPFERQLQDHSIPKREIIQYQSKKYLTGANSLLKLIDAYYKNNQGSAFKFFQDLPAMYGQLAKITSTFGNLTEFKEFTRLFKEIPFDNSSKSFVHQFGSSEFLPMMNLFYLIKEDYLFNFKKIVDRTLTLAKMLEKTINPVFSQLQSNCISPLHLLHLTLYTHQSVIMQTKKQEEWNHKLGKKIELVINNSVELYAAKMGVFSALTHTRQAFTIMDLKSIHFKYHAVIRELRELIKIIPDKHPIIKNVESMIDIFSSIIMAININGAIELLTRPVGGNPASLTDSTEMRFFKDLCDQITHKITNTYKFITYDNFVKMAKHPDWNKPSCRKLKNLVDEFLLEWKEWHQKIIDLPSINNINIETVCFQLTALLKEHHLKLCYLHSIALKISESELQEDTKNLIEHINAVNLHFEILIFHPMAPLFKYLNQVKLLKSDVQNKKKKTRNQTRKIKQAQASSKPAPAKATAKIKPQSSAPIKKFVPYISSHTMHPMHEAWKTSTVVDKIMWIERFCQHIPSFFFETVSSTHSHDRGDTHLAYFKQEVAQTLKSTMEELKELAITREDLSSPPAYLSSLNLLLATSIEQTLKLILICREISIPEEILKRHETTPFLNLLFQAASEGIRDLPVLDNSQEDFIHALRDVIPITSRYHGFAFDQLTEQIALLQNRSDQNLRIGQLANEQLNIGLNLIATLLNSLDLDHKIEPKGAQEALVKELIETINPTPKKGLGSHGAVALVTEIQETLTNIEALRHHQFHCPVIPLNTEEDSHQSHRRQLIISESLGNLTSATHHLKDLFSNPSAKTACLNFAKACYLHESVILEQALLLVLNHFPIASPDDPNKHILFSLQSGRVIKNSHELRKYVEFLNTYFSTRQDNPVQQALTSYLPRLHALTLYLKNDYRYDAGQRIQSGESLMAPLSILRSCTKLNQYLLIEQMTEEDQRLVAESGFEDWLPAYLQENVEEPIVDTLRIVLELINSYKKSIE